MICLNILQIDAYQKYLPKNGRRKATHKVEMTREVLNMMEHQRVLDVPTGSNSSKLLAKGFSNNAYLFSVKDTTDEEEIARKRSDP